LPEERRVIACAAPSAIALGPLIAALTHAPLGLGAIELVNQAGAAVLRDDLKDVAGGWLLLVLCEGHPRVVERQTWEVMRAAASAGVETRSVGDGEAAAALIDEIAGLALPGDQESLVISVGVRPGDTVTVVDRLAVHLSGVTTGAPAALHAHAGTGVIHARLRTATAGMPALVAGLRADITERGGHLVVRSCPIEVKARIDVWGPSSAAGLMRDLKHALDPQAILNRGRFAHGL
jgi:FAD/FMN-containing dehydrogenase